MRWKCVGSTDELTARNDPELLLWLCFSYYPPVSFRFFVSVFRYLRCLLNFRSSRSWCLNDSPFEIVPSLPPQDTNKLPGQLFDGDDQCEFQYGFGWRLSPYSPVRTSLTGYQRCGYLLPTVWIEMENPRNSRKLDPITFYATLYSTCAYCPL